MFISADTQPAPSPNAARSLQELIAKVRALGLTAGVFHVPTTRRPLLYDHNGAPPAPLTQAEWMQCLFELEVDGASSSWTENARLTARTRAVNGEVPLALACIKYRGPTAELIAGVVDAFANDREIPVPENLEGLIRQDLFLGASALLPSTFEGFTRLPYAHHGQTVTYRLVEPIWSNPDAARPGDVVVDAGDGSQPRRIAWGETFQVTYPTTGVKTISVRLQVGERELMALAALDVRASFRAKPYDLQWDLQGGGTAWIWLGAGNKALTRPVIMCEGFPGGYTWDFLYEKYNQQNLLTDILATGRDFIIVSFRDVARQGIFESAAILQDCIVKANQAKLSSAPIYVGGASMGGLVARCALLMMQSEGIDPQTAKMITFDSPHCGAYVPVSAQTFLWFFGQKYQEAQEMLTLLTCKSAKQMLQYFAADGGSGPLTSPEREEFMTKVTQLGGYPRGVEVIAVADGRGDGKIQESGGQPENLSIKYHENIDPLVFVWLYNLPSPKDDWTQVSSMYNMAIDFFCIHNWNVNNTYSYDGAPGGLSNVYQQVKSSLDGAHCGTDAICTLNFNSFIPTVSAVGIGGDPSLPVDTSKSPFAHVYVSPDNRDHVELTPEMKKQLLEWIEVAVPALAVD